MGKKISEHVTWVGKVDWELKRFHGDEFFTQTEDPATIPI